MIEGMAADSLFIAPVPSDAGILRKILIIRRQTANSSSNHFGSLSHSVRSAMPRTRLRVRATMSADRDGRARRSQPALPSRPSRPAAAPCGKYPGSACARPDRSRSTARCRSPPVKCSLKKNSRASSITASIRSRGLVHRGRRGAGSAPGPARRHIRGWRRQADPWSGNDAAARPRTSPASAATSAVRKRA